MNYDRVIIEVSNDGTVFIKVTKACFNRIKKEFQSAIINLVTTFKKEIESNFEFARKAVASLYTTFFNFTELEEHKSIHFFVKENIENVFLDTLINESEISWVNIVSIARQFTKGNIAVEVQLKD